MKNSGYTDVYALFGGLDAWIKQGYKTESGTR